MVEKEKDMRLSKLKWNDNQRSDTKQQDKDKKYI